MSTDSGSAKNDRFGLDAYSPAEVQAKVEILGVKKARMPFLACFMLSMVAGVGIGLGGMYYSLVLGDPTLGFAASKLLGGLVFCLGLSIVVIGGAELFTGNCLIVMAWANRQLSTMGVLRNWSIVWIGNFVGSLVLVYLLYVSKYADANHGAVAAALIKVAAGKTSLDFTTIFVRGILCNLLVCLAVWLTYAGRSVVDKMSAMILPVAAFVAAGFEHCVANMFFLPMGYVLLHTGHAAPEGVDVSALTLPGIVHNLVPATLGNIVGGAVFVGIVYWLIYRKSIGGINSGAK
ncbi:MAG: formate/nitrite transporter family protein [Rhizomicrobium sp.]